MTGISAAHGWKRQRRHDEALIGLWWLQDHVQVPGIRETEAGAIGYDGGVEDEEGGIVGLVLLVGGLVSRLWYVDWDCRGEGLGLFLWISSWVLGGCCHSHTVVQPQPVSHILPQGVETFSVIK